MRSLEQLLVLCHFSSKADKSDRGSAIPSQGHPTSTCSRVCGCSTPRVSLRVGARRAGCSSLRRRLLLCPGLAPLAVTRLLAPVRRYASTSSRSCSCSRVLWSRCRCQTFRMVASFLPGFFNLEQVRSRYGQIELPLNLFSFNAPEQVVKVTAATPRGAVKLLARGDKFLCQDAPGPRPRV